MPFRDNKITIRQQRHCTPTSSHSRSPIGFGHECAELARVSKTRRLSKRNTCEFALWRKSQSNRCGTRLPLSRYPNATGMT